MVIAFNDTAENGGNIGNLCFSLCLIFCGVLATPSQFPGFWIWLYRVSPFTYLAEVRGSSPHLAPPPPPQPGTLAGVASLSQDLTLTLLLSPRHRACSRPRSAGRPSSARRRSSSTSRRRPASRAPTTWARTSRSQAARSTRPTVHVRRPLSPHVGESGGRARRRRRLLVPPNGMLTMFLRRLARRLVLPDLGHQHLPALVLVQLRQPLARVRPLPLGARVDLSASLVAAADSPSPSSSQLRHHVGVHHLQRRRRPRLLLPRAHGASPLAPRRRAGLSLARASR